MHGLIEPTALSGLDLICARWSKTYREFATVPSGHGWDHFWKSIRSAREMLGSEVCSGFAVKDEVLIDDSVKHTVRIQQSYNILIGQLYYAMMSAQWWWFGQDTGHKLGLPGLGNKIELQVMAPGTNQDLGSTDKCVKA